MRQSKSLSASGYVVSDGPPPSPLEHPYMAFSLKDNEDDVALAFQRRYGFHPPWIHESLGNLLAGPVPTPEN